MSHQTTHYIYRAVKLWDAKSLPCPKCGKKVRRQRTVEQTLNPFNVKADGSEKNAQDIRLELSEELAVWVQEPELCTGCEKGE